MCFVKQYIWIMVYLFKTHSGFFFISLLLYEFYVFVFAYLYILSFPLWITGVNRKIVFNPSNAFC